MNTTLGFILALITTGGAFWTMYSLPDPPAVSYVLLCILLLATIAGLFWVTSKKKSPVLFTVSFMAAGYWTFIKASYDKIVNTSNAVLTWLGKNPYLDPYLNISPGTILKASYILLLIPAGIIALLIVRAIKNYNKFNDSEDKITGIIDLIKKLLNRKNDYEYLDVELCTDTNTSSTVTFKGRDRYTSLGLIGTTGTGKTSSIFVPMIYQDLMRKAKGHKLAVTVMEPTKDLTDKVAEMCDKLEIPCVYIDPTNPDTQRFNILQGDKEVAAEATRSVLTSLFGNQQAFFAQVQQTMARNTVLLLKELYGDDLDITDVTRTLRDVNILERQVTLLKRKKGQTNLVQYFEFEPLGELREKYNQFAAGLRQQLEDIGGNALLKRTMSKPSSVNLDTHLAEGGVLIVNTAMGDLMKKLSEVFGQYILIHLIYAIFRKHPKTWKIPHALYIDELPKYLGPEVGFDDLVAIGRKFGNITTVAMQSTSQLNDKLKSNDATRTILNNCRSKIVFGGMDSQDAKLFEEEFGKEQTQMAQATYQNRVILPVFWAKSYRTTNMIEPRYTYTQLMELEEYQFIYRIMRDARLQPPGQGKGRLVDIDKLKPPNELMLKKAKEVIKNKAVELHNNVKEAREKKQQQPNHYDVKIKMPQQEKQEAHTEPEEVEINKQQSEPKEPETAIHDNDEHNNNEEAIYEMVIVPPEPAQHHNTAAEEKKPNTPKNDEPPQKTIIDNNNDKFWGD